MNISSLVKGAKKIWLSTHISADGDGLGSEMALYFALKKNGYDVSVIHNDPIPPRYEFLTYGVEILAANESTGQKFSKDDVCIIFDTHDPKLCQPLLEHLLKADVQIVFIDHHVSDKTNLPRTIYLIDENASCTGELALEIIESMEIPLDVKVATCLYASLIFDTQNFKNMRSPVKIFDMAKKLVLAGADHKTLNRSLFENWTINKFNYLSKLIKNVTYKNNDTAIICISKKDLTEYNLSSDEVSDLVDLFMGLKNLNVSIVIREEAEQFFKLSFRSRKNEILSWAREFGGGGHLHSAGAWVKATEAQIIDKLNFLIQKSS
jgi:phosphoesterase RecJ-like protein